jgi:hypothetical protein
MPLPTSEPGREACRAQGNGRRHVKRRCRGTVVVWQRPQLLVSNQESPAVVIFKDDDNSYRAWLKANLHGFVVNTERSPSARYLKLHCAECTHIKT